MEVEWARKKWHEHPSLYGKSSDIIWETGEIPNLNKDELLMNLLPKGEKWNKNISNVTF